MIMLRITLKIGEVLTCRISDRIAIAEYAILPDYVASIEILSYQPE